MIGRCLVSQLLPVQARVLVQRVVPYKYQYGMLIQYTSSDTQGSIHIRLRFYFYGDLYRTAVLVRGVFARVFCIGGTQVKQTPASYVTRNRMFLSKNVSWSPSLDKNRGVGIQILVSVRALVRQSQETDCWPPITSHHMDSALSSMAKTPLVGFQEGLGFYIQYHGFNCGCWWSSTDIFVWQ